MARDTAQRCIRVMIVYGEDGGEPVSRDGQLRTDLHIGQTQFIRERADIRVGKMAAREGLKVE
jgi:hypothetical protein